MNRNDSERFLIILGSGGFARELYFHIKDIYPVQIIFLDTYSSDDKFILDGQIFCIYRTWNIPKEYREFIIGVGNPSYKVKLASEAIERNLTPCLPLIHPSCTVQDAKIGRGTIVAPGCRMTTNVSVGDHVILNLNVTIGHDTRIEDFCTINPGVQISGNVIVEEQSLLGTGCIIREKIRIGAKCIIGAQAAIVSDSISSSTYVGVPGKKITQK